MLFNKQSPGGYDISSSLGGPALVLSNPSRGGQTELSSDQTIFERTHVLGALELHGLEKDSSALLPEQRSGTCPIRGHFGLRGRFEAHTSLTSGLVERIFVHNFLLTFVVSGESQQQSSILIRTPSENLVGSIRTKGSS